MSRRLNPRLIKIHRSYTVEEVAKLFALHKNTVRAQGKAWFIVGAPTKKERDWWQVKLGGLLLLLNPGIEECKRRAYARGTPLAAAGVAAWEAKSCMHWSPPVPRRRIGPDGWFLNDDVDEADIVLAKELSP
jgi:hypothetical protein